MHSDLDSELRCPKCTKELNTHKCEGIPAGQYNGSSKDLGNTIIRKYYNNSFSSHAFYVLPPNLSTGSDRNGIAAHHLLTSHSVEPKEYSALIRMLGYSINHRNNGVLLPSLMKVACAYAVPLHRGNHSATFMFDVDDNLYDRGEERELVIYPTYNKFDEIIELNYEELVGTLVMNVCHTFIAKDICDVDKRKNIAKDFIVAMDEESQKTFEKVEKFSWMLTSDGLDYKAGNIGCCKCNRLKNKRRKIKRVLEKEGEKLPSINDSPKAFWRAILSSTDLMDKLKKLNKNNNYKYICIAGSGHKKFKVINNFYDERKKIEKFIGFK